MMEGFPLECGTLYPCFVDATPGSSVDNLPLAVKSSELVFPCSKMFHVNYTEERVSIHFDSPLVVDVNGVPRSFVPGDVLTIFVK